MAALIGALRVTLGIDTAAFTDGIKQAQGKLANVGKSLQSVGSSLSQKVTAPLLAAAGAIGLGVSRMAGDMSELGNQAKLANTSVDAFQRLAYAAKTVGIEQEKLTDILKDVNDKVGDFISTGGGEMQSFFENIAPKIGLTADAFRGLSGADALQLYVTSLEKAGLSQSEMTFYMESIADEATALIPILANNGAEYQRLGEQASRFGLVSQGNVESAQRFQEAMRGLALATQSLGRAFVDSGVLELLTSLVTKVTEWISALNAANPGLTRFILVAGGLAAALGPVLVVMGVLATALAAIGAPVAAVIAGIVALTAAVVAFWPEIKQAAEAVRQFALDVGEAFMQAVEMARERTSEMFAYLGGLKDQFVAIGRDIIDGMLSGLREKWQSVKEWFSGLADSIPQWVRDKLGIHSPSTVFAEIGQNIMQGLSGGLASMSGQVQSDVGNLASSLAQEFTNILTGASSFKEAMGNILGQVGGSYLSKGLSGLTSAITGVPGFAGGTNFAPGGLAVVGERGPELVNLPRGSRVTPNSELGGLGGASQIEVTLGEGLEGRILSKAQGQSIVIARQAAGAVEAKVPGIMAEHQRRRA